MGRKGAVGFGGDVDTGAGWYIVQDDWQVGGIGNRMEVANQSSLGGFVVIRGDVQQRIGSGTLCLLGHPDSVGGMVASSACDDRHSALYTLDGVGNTVYMLLVGHGSGFTGGSADNDGIGAVFNLVINDTTQLIIVDRFIGIHRSDDGNACSGKNGFLHHIAASFRLVKIALAGKRFCHQDGATCRTADGVVGQADKLVVVLGIRAQSADRNTHAAL